METHRLLFVIANDTYGGGERVFSQIINALPQDHYEVFIASTPGGEFHRSITRDGVTVCPLDFSHRFNPLLLIKLLQIIKKYRIDLVHGQGARADFYARSAAHLARVRCMSTVAMPVEGFDVSYLKRYIYCLFDHFTERYVDRFLLCSEALRKTYVEKHMVPSEKAVRIYNGIELDKYSPETGQDHTARLKEELGLDSVSVLVGAIGRMSWQKGFEYLVRAVAAVRAAVPEVRVLFVGDGPLKDDLEHLARQSGVEDTTVFTGFRSDIKDILSAIDVLAVPSLREGFPMVTLEAMAMAKPIVATEIKGMDEQVLDMKTGLSIPPADTDSLGSAIIRLLKNKDLARRLGRNAREYVTDNFSLDKMLQETQDVYKSILD